MLPIADLSRFPLSRFPLCLPMLPIADLSRFPLCPAFRSSPGRQSQQWREQADDILGQLANPAGFGQLAKAVTLKTRGPGGDIVHLCVGIEEKGHFVVEKEAAVVHVRRADYRELVVKNDGLGMKHDRLVEQYLSSRRSCFM